ncbi:hypothetical protein SAMN05421882_102347 [Nitrosomonas communis]|uniref:Uncharacterized protein n=1 Tax=Nitrosomonas communis TaxID=44574 RepID=A0A1H2VQY6_9PROT|nr:hypothetical protein SAMN05421882_102347 [Nitrosomonas communis]
MTPLLDKTKSLVHKTVKLLVTNEYKLLFPDNFLAILFITAAVISKDRQRKLLCKKVIS